MTKKTFLLSFLLGMAGVLVGSQQAQAITISDSANISGNPNFNSLFTLDQFDPGLGTLDSIELILDLDLSGGSFSVDNDGGTPANNITITVGANGGLNPFGLGSTVGFSDIPTALLLDTFGNPDPIAAETSGVFNLAANDGDGSGFDAGGPDFATLSGVNQSDQVSGFVDPSSFSTYTGVGTLSFSSQFDSTSGFEGTGNLAGAFTSTSASSTLTVVYDYTPFDDPAAVPFEAESGMAVVAVGGLIAYRKLRKRGQNQIDA